MPSFIKVFILTSWFLCGGAFPVRKLKGYERDNYDVAHSSNCTSSEKFPKQGLRNEENLMRQRMAGIPTKKTDIPAKNILAVTSFFVFGIAIVGGLCFVNIIYFWQNRFTFKYFNKICRRNLKGTSYYDIEVQSDDGDFVNQLEEEEESGEENDTVQTGKRLMNGQHKKHQFEKPNFKTSNEETEDDSQREKTLKMEGKKGLLDDDRMARKAKSAELKNRESADKKDMKAKIKKAMEKGKPNKEWTNIKGKRKEATKGLKNMKEKIKDLKKKKGLLKVKKSPEKMKATMKSKMIKLRKKTTLRKPKLKRLKRRKKMETLKLKRKKKNFFKKIKVKKPKLKVFKKRKNMFKKLKVKKPKMKFFKKRK